MSIATDAQRGADLLGGRVDACVSVVVVAAGEVVVVAAYWASVVAVRLRRANWLPEWPSKMAT